MRKRIFLRRIFRRQKKYLVIQPHNCDGIRTRNPWIRSPVRYPIAPHSRLNLDVEKKSLSRWRDSNSRPPAYKAGAITTMLHRQIVTERFGRKKLSWVFLVRMYFFFGACFFFFAPIFFSQQMANACPMGYTCSTT